jgi:dCTP deaminase
MLLTDSDIRRLCNNPNEWHTLDGPMVDPFSEAVSGGGVIGYGLSSCGYDIRLGNEVWYLKSTGEAINPKKMKDPDYLNKVMDKRTFLDGEAVIVPANGYVLGVSKERFNIPNHIAGRCVGKSTLARCAVHINVTPLEPGWRGQLTIEIGNAGPAPVVVFAGEGIAQIQFEQLTARPEKTYADKCNGAAGKYQDQSGVTLAKVL